MKSDKRNFAKLNREKLDKILFLKQKYIESSFQRNLRDVVYKAKRKIDLINSLD